MPKLGISPPPQRAAHAGSIQYNGKSSADRPFDCTHVPPDLVTGKGFGQGIEPLPELPSVGTQAPNRDGVESFVDGLSRSDATIEVKLGHGRILNLKQDLVAAPGNQPSIAVGNVDIIDIVPVTARQIRILGTHLGSTDLSITLANGQSITFDVKVIADLEILKGQLRQTFPHALIKLGQTGDCLVVEGQARDSMQVAKIIETIRNAVRAEVNAGTSAGTSPQPDPAPSTALGPAPNSGPDPLAPTTSNASTLRILNLLRVPGSQQVLLKVRVAELNRTALRQVGANVLGYDAKSGSIFGTNIGSPTTANGSVNPFTLNTSRAFTNASGTNSISSTIPNAARGLVGAASGNLTSSTTLFGIFQNSNFDVFLNALRQNSILKILAEPNLVALNGHRASFLAGGEFPIPVPQVAASGVASTITVNFKKFGVQLDFLPVILEGDVIRLTVDPEVSSIDFSIGTTLVAGGTQVPGLNTRNAHTTVELKQGQTLAIAGLMQVTLEGTTTRVPGLGDLPILGPFFSNTTNRRVEKELVVLVTPYLVEPMSADQLPPVPGDKVGTPNDLEFYLLNRIEGRTGRDFRATTDGYDPLRIGRILRLERKNVRGPFGYSD